jgi:hypothetical protein
MEVIEGGSSSDEGVISRMLLLGGDEESEDFLAGMDAGVILFLLNECRVKGEDPASLDPLPAFKCAKPAIEKIAKYCGVSVTYMDILEPGNEERVFCKFQSLRGQLSLVS